MEGRRERGQSVRARERENWGQRKMGDSKEGRKGGKEEWEAKTSGERSRRGNETGRAKEALERRLIYHSGRHRAVVFKERLRETEPV